MLEPGEDPHLRPKTLAKLVPSCPPWMFTRCRLMAQLVGNGGAATAAER